jgi:filamentous hemagglutinin family protein
VALLVAQLLLVRSAAAQVLPTGGALASGSASIGPAANGSLTIRQGSDRAIVHWQGFSIGQGGSVTIQQPGPNAAILNRVTGSAGSDIAGSLSANGRVYLVNPNGIEITSSGRVSAQSFTASTLGISDDDFNRGNLSFQGQGASATVRNAGTIRVSRGGDAVLIGGRVENTGVIVAPGGRVGLAASERVRVDVEGDGFLTVESPSNDPDKARALINHAGRIRANGGRVEMRAATSADVARAAIRVTGAVEASAVSRGPGGAVTFGAGGAATKPRAATQTAAGTRSAARQTTVARTTSRGAGAVVVAGGPGGQVAITGRIAANGATSARGGSVTITGRDIALSGARVSADGGVGGGAIRIGGELQGGAGLPTARTLTVDAATLITADAAARGDGGRVILWSDGETSFSGNIGARGGPRGGNGGFVEVSGKALLSYQGFADLRAPLGRTGDLLLDPYDITISAGAQTTGAGFTANGNDSVINATTLLAALSAANVTVSTGSSGTQPGDITVASPLSWTANTMLTLNAARDIRVNAAITHGGASGGLSLAAAGAIVIDAPITVTGGGAVSLAARNDFTTIDGFFTVPAITFGGSRPGGSGSIVFQPNAAQASQALTINGESYTLLRSMADVQAIGDGDPSFSGRYALAGPLDASGTIYAGPVFGPTGFFGIVTGLGNAISNLTITGGGSVGLVGVNGGVVRDIALAGGRIEATGGGSSAGALAGTNWGVVLNARSSATVVGSADAGGLVGTNDGSNGTDALVRNVWASGDVSAASAGGVVGRNMVGVVDVARASGAVIGGNAGGAVGVNSGSAIVRASEATGAVQGATVGGLVGLNDFGGRIELSRASGDVTGTSASWGAGGLVGRNTGAANAANTTTVITQSYATGAVTGLGPLGGLVGENAGYVGDSYAMGSVTVPDLRGYVVMGGLVGDNTGGSVERSFATGLVSAPRGFSFGYMVGGLIGFGGGTAAAYFDPAISGQGGGGTSVTTRQLQGLDPLPGGGSITDAGRLGPAFAGGANGFYPYLAWFFPNGVQAISGTVQRDATEIGSPTNGTITGLPGQGMRFSPAPITIGVASGATSLPSVTAGANGYFYTLVPAGTLATGAPFVAYVAQGSSAAVARGTVAGVATGGVDILSRSVTVSTSATSLADPTIPTLAAARADALAATTVPAAAAAIGAAQGLGLRAAGAFTIDQPLTLAGGAALAVSTPAGRPLTISAPLAVRDAGALALSAGGSLSLNAPLAVDSGGVFTARSDQFQPITVGGAVTVSGGGAAGFFASGALTVDADMRVTGAGQVSLAYNAANPTDLSFGAGRSLRFLADTGGSTANQRLTINGEDYRLLRSYAEMASWMGGGQGSPVLDGNPPNLREGSARRIALAQPVDAAGGGEQLIIAGIFNGLGNTISNVSMTGGSSFYQNTGPGLFDVWSGGSYATATLRDVGLINPTINAQTVNVVLGAGTLVAINRGGLIVNASSTGGAITNAVDNRSAAVGGLVGVNDGTILRSWADTSAMGAAGGDRVGGLVGLNRGTISQSYATGLVRAGDGSTVGGLVGTSGGLVTQSYATGAALVGGSGGSAGGLVGGNTGTISLSYATGMTLTEANGISGGLVGSNGGQVNQSYATGVAVAGAGGFAGGLVGASFNGALNNSFWDIGTSGRTQALGSGTAGVNVVGLTTAQLQGAALTGTGVTGALTDAGNLSAAFAGGTGGLYPYLAWRFPGGVQAVSGTAYTDAGATPAASGANGPVTVSVVSGGSLFGRAATGANGAWYVFGAAGSVPNGTNLVAFTTANAQTGAASSATFLPSTYTAAAPNQTGVNLSGGWRIDRPGTGIATLSALDTAYGATVTGTGAAALTFANRQITSSAASFDFNQALTITGTLALSGASVTQSAALGASALVATGGDVTLTNAGNTIGAAAANAGSLSLATSGALTIGSVSNAAGSATMGVTAIGAVSLSAGGALTLNAAVSGASPVLASAAGFTNTAGASAVTATDQGGRWLVYASSPAVSSFGGLDSGNTAIWNTAAGASVSATGNRYVFALQPTLTLAAGSTSKTYGDDGSAAVAAAYTITGLQAGVAGAFLGDTLANVLTGTPSMTSTGTAVGAGVAGSPYAITAALGTLSASGGYALAVSPTAGALTVTARPITITADAQSRVYGDANPVLSWQVGGRGLVGSDALSGALATSATTASGVGTYAITQGTLAASGNYAVTYQGANLAVTARSITIAATDVVKVVGAPDPTLTFSIVAGRLVDGDAFAGVPSRQPGETVGVYAIGRGSLEFGPNYVVTFVNGRFTIAPTPTGPALGMPSPNIFVSWPLAPSRLFATDVLDGLMDSPPRFDASGRSLHASSPLRSGGGTSCFLDSRGILVCEASP